MNIFPLRVKLITTSRYLSKESGLRFRIIFDYRYFIWEEFTLGQRIIFDYRYFIWGEFTFKNLYLIIDILSGRYLLLGICYKILRKV